MKKQIFVRRAQIMKIRHIIPALSVGGLLGELCGKRSRKLTHEYQEVGKAGIERRDSQTRRVARVSHRSRLGVWICYICAVGVVVRDQCRSESAPERTCLAVRIPFPTPRGWKVISAHRKSQRPRKEKYCQQSIHQQHRGSSAGSRRRRRRLSIISLWFANSDPSDMVYRSRLHRFPLLHANPSSRKKVVSS